MDFHEFWSMGVSNGKEQPAAPIETFAQFQVGFLSSEDFYRIPSICIVFYRFPSIHRFSQIFMDFVDFHGFRGMDWMPEGLKEGPAALIETFARFQPGFLSSEAFHRIS